MHIQDMEACKSYVYANRLLADRYRAKAEEVLQAALSLADIESRRQLTDLSRAVEERGARFASLATLQEQDLGVRCHCPSLD